MALFSNLRSFFAGQDDQSAKCFRLILMRTGGSVLNFFDPDNPLTGPGMQDSVLAAQQLVQEGWIPDLVLCSNATRTHQTWQLVERVLGPEKKIRLELTRLLSLTEDEETAARLIRWQSSRDTTIMIVGHSPVLQKLTYSLCGQRILFWTSDVVLLEINGTSWSKVMKQKGEWRVSKRILARGEESLGISRPKDELKFWDLFNH